MTAYGFGLYGMYGPVTDPGERVFTQKVRALGVNVGDSPYRDFEVNNIVLKVKALPVTPDRKLIFFGSSLGANNLPVIASYLSEYKIDGIWGFQASSGGAKVPIGPNVLFAHEVYNPFGPMTFWMGNYKWVLAPGNKKTTLITSKRYDFHPGETEAAQNMFLAEIKRVIDAP